MKYVFIAILSLMLVVPVNAQMFGQAGQNDKEPMHDSMMDDDEVGQRQNLRQTLQNASDEQKLQVRENVQNRLSNMVENHVNRLEKRFNMYNTRLSAIIAKMESNDVIIANTEAVDTLNTAKQDLQDANDMAKQTLDALKTIQTSGTVDRASLEQVKTLAQQTVAMYKSVHSDLMSIISLVRSN